MLGGRDDRSKTCDSRCWKNEFDLEKNVKFDTIVS